MNKHFLLCICILLAAGSVRAEEAWTKYVNGRFGFSMNYPSVLVASREPQNGAGMEFHTPDKEFSVVAQGHFLMPDIGVTFEKSWQDELKALAGTITYKKKANSWYVVSGVLPNGTEYYHKFYVKDGNWVALNITYPHARNKKYDPWVERIEKGFVPFLEGNYDRITK